MGLARKICDWILGYTVKFERYVEFSSDALLFAEFGVYIRDSKIYSRGERLSSEESTRIRATPEYQKERAEIEKRVKENLPLDFANIVHAIGGTCLSAPRESI